MFSNIIFDLIIVIVFAVAGFIGVKVGFFSMLAKPFKYVGSIIITLTCSKPVGKFIIAPMIKNPVSNKVSSYLLDRVGELDPSNIIEELPTLVKLAASIAGIDLESIASGNAVQTVIENIISQVMEPIVLIISVVIAGIVLYILSKLLLGLVLWLINSVLDSGAIGVINKTLGCVFILIITFVAVWAIIGCSDLIINLPAVQNTEWGANFTGGFIYRFFKNLSIVDLLLSF